MAGRGAEARADRWPRGASKSVRAYAVKATRSIKIAFWSTTKSRFIAAIARGPRTPTRTTIRCAATWCASSWRSRRRGKIEDAWFDGEGCCISQASASLLTEWTCGRTVDEVKHFAAEQMLELFGAKLTPNRQKCCLLPWRVLQSAIYSPLAGPPPNAGGAKIMTASRRDGKSGGASGPRPIRSTWPGCGPIFRSWPPGCTTTCR